MNSFAYSPPLTQPTMPPDAIIMTVLTVIAIILIVVALISFLKKKPKK